MAEQDGRHVLDNTQVSKLLQEEMIGPSENPGSRPHLRKLIPKIFLKERETFLRLGPKAGPIYLRFRLLDLLGVRRSKRGIIARTARSVLFVCHGNIMRSPMAEAILKQSLTDVGCKGVRVASAGLHATPGKEAHPLAQTALMDIGLPLANHRAQLLTTEMVNQSDVVFAMDFQNEAELLALFPEAHDK